MDKREELRSVLNNMIENTPEAREAASQHFHNFLASKMRDISQKMTQPEASAVVDETNEE